MAKKPLVVLIHGLHQRGFIMRPLAKYLRGHGYRTHNHDYRSLSEPVAQHSKHLDVWLEKNHNPKEAIHLVGHSLGGLVIRDFIHRYPKWQIGRCVTLGTPHVGSTTAKYASRLVAPLVGKAYKDGLDGTVVPLADDICLGVIAGNSPYGLGHLLLSYHKRQITLDPLTAAQYKHDGTVYVFETRLPNATDHIVMPVTHTGMLINKNVAKQTAYFLEHGEFERL